MAKNTQIQVTNVTISEDFVVIEGIDIDRIVLAKDFYAELDEEPVVSYQFSRTEKAGAHMKYLLKVVSNSRACAKAKTFGDKLDALIGSFLILPDSFKAVA